MFELLNRRDWPPARAHEQRGRFWRSPMSSSEESSGQPRKRGGRTVKIAGGIAVWGAGLLANRFINKLITEHNAKRVEDKNLKVSVWSHQNDNSVQRSLESLIAAASSESSRMMPLTPPLHFAACTRMVQGDGRPFRSARDGRWKSARRQRWRGGLGLERPSVLCVVSLRPPQQPGPCAHLGLQRQRNGPYHRHAGYSAAWILAACCTLSLML